MEGRDDGRLPLSLRSGGRESKVKAPSESGPGESLFLVRRRPLPAVPSWGRGRDAGVSSSSAGLSSLPGAAPWGLHPQLDPRSKCHFGGGLGFNVWWGHKPSVPGNDPMRSSPSGGKPFLA